MKKSIKANWDNLTPYELDYFQKQYTAPYNMTLQFVEWLKNLGCIKPRSVLLDAGCGMGAVTCYLASVFPYVEFYGIEFDSMLSREGATRVEMLGLKNVTLEQGDLRELSKYSGLINGIISTQTLSWLESGEVALSSFSDTGCNWIAVSSLFYDGPVSVRTEVTDASSRTDARESRESFYNIYSIPQTIQYLKKKGFKNFDFKPFDIEIDLAQPDSRGMGTYTQQLMSGKKLQFSGPLFMPWYFIYASR